MLSLDDRKRCCQSGWEVMVPEKRTRLDEMQVWGGSYCWPLVGSSLALPSCSGLVARESCDKQGNMKEMVQMEEGERDMRRWIRESVLGEHSSPLEQLDRGLVTFSHYRQLVGEMSCDEVVLEGRARAFSSPSGHTQPVQISATRPRSTSPTSRDGMSQDRRAPFLPQGIRAPFMPLVRRAPFPPQDTRAPPSVPQGSGGGPFLLRPPTQHGLFRAFTPWKNSMQSLRLPFGGGARRAQWQERRNYLGGS